MKSILEKLSKKRNIGVVGMLATEERDAETFIQENGYGSLHIKVNNTPLLVINGITEENLNTMVEQNDIRISLYKTTDNFNEFRSQIINAVGINESEATIYEREQFSYNRALQLHTKGQELQWEKI